jgi:hypothetical protein
MEQNNGHRNSGMVEWAKLRIRDNELIHKEMPWFDAAGTLHSHESEERQPMNV